MGLVVQVSVGTGLRKHRKKGQCRAMSIRVACSVCAGALAVTHISYCFPKAAIQPFKAANFIQGGHCHCEVRVASRLGVF